MRKERKKIYASIFVTILLLAISPTALSDGIDEEVDPDGNNNPNNIAWEKIEPILQKYKQDVELINNYIYQYIEENGCIDGNFELTPELQQKIDKIIEEIGIEDGGGKTKEKSSFFINIIKRIGTLFFKNKIDMNDFFKELKTEDETRNSVGLKQDKFDIKMLSIWMSSKKKDWYMNHVVRSPSEGDRVFFHYKYSLTGPTAILCFKRMLKLDGQVFEADFVNNNFVGKTYVVCCSKAWAVTTGTHTIEAEVDYTHMIPESNENNNEKSYTFSVELEDGITKIELHPRMFGFIPIGLDVKIYMSHCYIDNNLGPGLEWELTGLALLALMISPHIGLEVALIIAGLLIYYGLDAIEDTDEGRGVIITAYINAFIWPQDITLRPQ